MNAMTKFHPDLDLMTEHSAGTLSLAQSTCVSVHIGYCEHCQRVAGQLSDVGAALFEELEPVPVGDVLLEAVLARLDEVPPLTYATTAPVESGSAPAILQRLMKGDFSDLTWKSIGKSLRISYLKTGDPKFASSLPFSFR